MKKAKCLLMIFVIAAMVSMSMSAFTYAQPQPPEQQVNIYAWTDKVDYDPGESGKLTIVIRNNRTDVDGNLILYNITIRYPWFSYNGEKWEGNDTIIINDTLMKNEAKTYTRTFTVPTDGRIASAFATYGAQIVITAKVDKAPYSYTSRTSIYVRGIAYPMTIQEWDKMITLLTIQAVLMIVCTIIIAAIIFLSTRRSRAFWVEEEEKEKSK